MQVIFGASLRFIVLHTCTDNCESKLNAKNVEPLRMDDCHTTIINIIPYTLSGWGTKLKSREAFWTCWTPRRGQSSKGAWNVLIFVWTEGRLVSCDEGFLSLWCTLCSSSHSCWRMLIWCSLASLSSADSVASLSHWRSLICSNLASCSSVDSVAVFHMVMFSLHWLNNVYSTEHVSLRTRVSHAHDMC